MWGVKIGKSWILLSLLILPAAVQADDVDAVLQSMYDDCYAVYNPQFIAAQEMLPAAPLDIDLESLNNIPEGLGLDADTLSGLSEMLAESKAILAPMTQQAYADLAQLNVDLTKCYAAKAEAAPELLPQAQVLVERAETDLAEIAAYDFTKSYEPSPSGTTVVTVPARATKTIRLRTYCLDGDRGTPTAGEEYYLAATAAQLQDDTLCDLLRQANTPQDIGNLQTAIWSTIDTTIKPSAEAAEETADKAATTNQNKLGEKAKKKSAIGADESTQNTLSNLLAARPVVAGGLMGVGLSDIVLFSILGLLWRKQFSAKRKIGVLVGIGVGVLTAAAGVTLWFWSPQPASADTTAEASLLTAARDGQVLIKAVSTGSFTSLDVTITNLTGQAVTLDTSCLTFIPTTSTPPAGTTTTSSDTGSVTDGNGDETGDETANDDSADDSTSEDGTTDEDWFDDDVHESQRLVSDDIITDDPPPLPGDPPLPEDTFDIEKLKKETEQKVRDAKKKFEENPTEDNLKDLMKETAKCQAVGCSEGDALDSAGDAWQKAVDQAVKDYQSDPSRDNLQALKRAAEVGQMLGSNTGAAVDIILSASGL